MKYKLLGRNTGLRVAEQALGVGTFGTRWGYGSSKEEAQRVLDGYLAAGGNFIDAADSYQFGEAESWLGELLGGRREQVVLASKYTFGVTPDAGRVEMGNNRRHLARAVEGSLRRLGTDHLDLLWVHMPDEVTPSEELVRGLDDLARTGKIVYAGLSDFPAWRVARAATLAELRGTLPIAAIQVEYSLVERSVERELLPMASALGLGVLGWSPLGGGLLTGKYRRGETGRATDWKNLIHDESDARKTATVDAVLAVAEEVGRSPGQVALAWVASKGVTPILGARTLAQLEDNLAATSLQLSGEQLLRLDQASAIPLGFPHELVAANRARIAGGDLSVVELPPFPVA